MSVVTGVLVVAALQAPAQFAVVSGSDTSLVPVGEAIEVVDGADVELLAVPFTAEGDPIEVRSAWWHSGDNPVFELAKNGEFFTIGPGEDRVMFHWVPAGADDDAHAQLVWVLIRVVAREGG